MPAMMLQRPCLRRFLIVPTLQRHQDGVDPLPGGVLFFACPKKRTKRKGSPAAETTPADGLRNRRGKNSLRSDSLPLFPGSAPRRPAQRQRAVFLPRKPVLPRTVLLAGPAFLFAAGISEGDRSHAPAWERGPDAPASSEWRGMGPGLWEVSRPNRENRKRPTVLNETGRWSVRGGVSTLERGNDQKEKTRLAGGQSCTARGEPSSGFLLLPVQESNGHLSMPPT